MDTVKFDSKNVKMVAHRGCSGLETENTCSAFVAAGNRSYYGIESDVYVTSDGKYIISHDNNTRRITGKDYVVEKTDFETLRSLPVLDRDGCFSRGDLKLASLEEYILICKKYEKVCVLELKSTFTKDQLKEIKDIFDRYAYSEKVIFISFGLQNLVLLKEIDPCVKAQYLTAEFTPELIGTLTKHGLDIDIHHSALNSETVAAFKDAGIRINTWTCDDPKLGEQLADLGVDYITSNILE